MPSPTRSPRPSRRRAVILTSLAVIAVGGLLSQTAPTLAAYVDTEFGRSSFLAGKWTVEGSIDRSDWRNHSADPAQQVMNLSVYDLYPGSPANYSPFSLRVAKGSTPSGAQITLSAARELDSSGKAGAVALRVVTSPDHSCSASSFPTKDTGTYVIGGPTTYAGALSAPTSGRASVTLPPSTTTAPGADVTYCFEVSLPENGSTDDLNGTILDAQWTFTAESR